MTERPDLLDDQSPRGIEVFQLTAEPGVPSCHIYMEAQIFAPDSKRFVVHRSAHPHGSWRKDPEHRYLLCDLENGGRLSPLTTEMGATAPSVSPDGKFFYYLVDETGVDSGRLTLRRVRLDGTGRETLHTLDRPFPGTSLRPSLLYPLSTISSDGKRLAAASFLGDFHKFGCHGGVFVYDLEKGTVRLVVHGEYWTNSHPQYCRSKDAEASHDIMLQDQHYLSHGRSERSRRPTRMRWRRLWWRVRRFVRRSITAPRRSLGCDIHLLRDDGTNLRNFPWGRDENEYCQGHQCWRGRTSFAITSTDTKDPKGCRLIESQAVGHAGHTGSRSPGGARNDLTRGVDAPSAYHFGTDIEGKRFITDWGCPSGFTLRTALFGEPGVDVLRNWTYLLDVHTSRQKRTHCHPFLSPDGKTAFFNSDESGTLQAFMIRGLETL